MTQLYSAERPATIWRKLALAALLAAAGSTGALAQSLNYTASSSTNVAGTFTDIATTGTAVTLSGLDDATSAAQPIGFTFNFNGQAFTQFQANTNGWMKLGSVAPSNDVGSIEYTSQNIIASSAPEDINIISVFGADLIGTAAAGSGIRVATTGTAPNRVCTIQWTNMAEYPLTSGVPVQYSRFTFQAKLYETTNNVELVYGPTTPGTTGAATDKIANVGLKGSGASNNQVVLATKAGTAAWSAATFINAPYGAQAFGYNRTVVADPGRTLRFAPGQAIANDAGIRTIYSAAKLATAAGGQHVVQAVVQNLGSNAQSAVAVRLTVSGANSFTSSKLISAIPVGGSSTVTFDPYTFPNVGTNNLRVELVLGDDDASNNALTYTQEVTATNLSIASNGTNTAGAVGFGTGATAAAFAVKYNTSAARTVTAITAFIYNAATSVAVGKTVYTAVLSPTGTVLGRTPDYVVTSADANARKTFTFATPVAVPAGDFLVALVQTNAAGGTAYFPMGTQTEDPTRPATFYTISPFSPTTGGTPADASSNNFGIYMLEATLGTVAGVSKALDNAVALYPNPSNGQVTLAISGAKANTSLQVEVTNALGQRVYAGSVRDNFSNQLDLSGLANGMYTLKVQSGDQYMVRNVSINK